MEERTWGPVNREEEGRSWGPVITAIDAGHQLRYTHCAPCGVQWPCPSIVAARKAQPGYGEQLALKRASAAAALSSLGAR